MLSGATVVVLIFLGLVVLSLAILVYTNLTPDTLRDDPAYIQSIWDTVFDFLDKWASAGAPAMTLLAVAAALYIGLNSLNQSRSVRQEQVKREQRDRDERREREQRDRTERYLKEIVDWAERISAGPFDDAIKTLVADIEYTRATAIITLDEWKAIRLEMTGKSKYILEIASNLDRSLEKSVSALIDLMKEYEELQLPYFQKQKSGYRSEIPKKKLRIYSSASSIIEECTKLLAGSLKSRP